MGLAIVFAPVAFLAQFHPANFRKPLVSAVFSR